MLKFQVQHTAAGPLAEGRESFLTAGRAAHGLPPRVPGSWRPPPLPEPSNRALAALAAQGAADAQQLGQGGSRGPAGPQIYVVDY